MPGEKYQGQKEKDGNKKNILVILLSHDWGATTRAARLIGYSDSCRFDKRPPDWLDKGFAFIQMANQNDLQKAIRMFSGHTLNNCKLKVNIARPREEVRRNSFNKRR